MASELPTPARDWALFLDFDGTLVHLRAHPDEVVADSHVKGLLQSLAQAFGGALAIVSGRSLDGLDRLLGPLQLPTAGIHGLERRGADGRVHRPADPTPAFDAARRALEGYAASHPGLLLEDKGNALALHFRRAPEQAAHALERMEAERRRLGEDFHLQHGKAVVELKPTAHHKGTVVEAFMAEPPFAGRRPVFLGDDVTDEDAFRTVNRLGGISVRVGDGAHTAARFRLASVDAALAWLAGLPERLP